MKNLKLFCFFAILFVANNLFAQNVSLSKFPNNKIMVVAHRADWREAPENSKRAIKKAREKKIDMIEIDLALTKDSVLILMHDKTIDRTTTGKGKPSDYTLAELKSFNLRDGLGSKTQMQVPTLEEVLNLTKGKILINLDKGFDYIHLVYPLLKDRKMLDQILFKGNESYQDFNTKYGNIKNKIHYMPIIQLNNTDNWTKINEYLKNYKIYGFEFIIGNDESNMIDFKKIKDQNIKIWVNSLWPQHNAGHEDDKVLSDPTIYQWYIDNNINIIQTDRPKELIDFLKSKNLKN